ncbi:uncharacterized protein LOC144710823 [Wolffia australiana]
MASSISNYCVSSCARSRSSAQSPVTRSLSASVRFPPSSSCCSLRRSSGVYSSSFGRGFCRGSVKSSVSNAEAVSVDEQEQAQGAPIKLLIQAYKEAILSGDEDAIARIELEIRAVEIARDDLAGKVNGLLTEIAGRKEKLLRLTADFENFRKRTDKDRISFSSGIRRDVIKSLLPIVDSFEDSRLQTNPETEKEKKVDTSYQGIYKQFVEVLRSLRVAVLQTVGNPFDPTLHEAVGRVQSQKFKEGTVVEEVARGFLLDDQALRPAKVKVAAAATAAAGAGDDSSPGK